MTLSTMQSALEPVPGRRCEPGCIQAGAQGGSALRNALLLLLVLALIGSCRYPEDINGSLDRIRGGVINVGLSENPPWVIRTETGADGIEPTIIRALAQKLDARVRWHWANESELMRALNAHQLDLVASGLEQQSPLSKQVTVTQPYFKSRFTVGFPGHIAGLPETLKGIEVQLLRVSPLSHALSDQGAIPEMRRRPDLTAPVAGPVWWLEANGLQPGPWTLATAKHVMALPPGENAWILAVQEHLNSYPRLDRLLNRMASEHEY